MEVNAMMSTQLMELQQTLQMSVMQNAMNMDAVAATKLLEDMPQQAASHPYKGAQVDISV